MGYRVFLLVLGTFTMCFLSPTFAQSDPSTAEPSVIPLPVSMQFSPGVFRLAPTTQIVATGDATSETRKLAQTLSPVLGFRLRIVEAEDSNHEVIHVDLDRSSRQQLGAEGYRLQVAPDRVRIVAAERAGLFYAIQTLRQLLPPAAFSSRPADRDSWSIRCVEITDYPRFSWRRLLVDPARHFLPKQDLVRFIEAMSWHKLNRLQLHLTDDQGWRIEIKKHPRLTEVGAWRDETLIGHLRDEPRRYDGQRHGGFYSQDDIREIVGYAADRHITIVPEIEMPGHARAAISAYPRLGVFPDRQAEIKPWTHWGISEDIFAPRPETITFCREVLTEVMELFPSPYIHIGGDEAIKTQWKASPEIQRVIQQRGLKDEAELQAWFTQQIDAFLTQHGRQLIGWDEILEGGLAPGAVVMSWRGEQGGIAAARAGHDVIMAPTSHTYFDYYQGPTESEPLAIGGHIPLDKVYGYEAIPAALTDEQAKHVLGAQAQLWSEYISDANHLQYMAFPRACTMSEVLWSPAAQRNYDSFLLRLRRHMERLQAAGVNHRALDNS